MQPVPIVFHIGPLQIHTYGIGLALTFWFALVYATRRMQGAGYPTEWLSRAFLWIVGAAIVGARLVHVVANIGYYQAHPVESLVVWHGGLSSWGGLLLAIPTGLWLAHRHCPVLAGWRGLDLIAPVLMASWAVGRLLGPNFEINGGGLPTNAWYGLHYAGQAGYRIPVPIFQALESFGVLLILLAIERWTRPQARPAGLLIAAMFAFWSLARFFDEYLWLASPPLWDAAEVIGLVMSAVGFAAMALLLVRHRRREVSPNMVVGTATDPRELPAPAARA